LACKFPNTPNLGSSSIGPHVISLYLRRVLPESPRWLLARGRFEEAEKILKKMARVNGKPLPANYMVELKVRRRDEMKRSITGGWGSVRM